MAAAAKFSLIFTSSPGLDHVDPSPTKLGFANFREMSVSCQRNITSALKNLAPIKAMEASRTPPYKVDVEVKPNGRAVTNDSDGSILHETSTNGRRSTNIMWHKCSVEKIDRQELLQQKGCVIWITGLSGSGKSTVACALTQALHARGKLTYILDGDNVRHGLNCDLTFKAEDRAENIRRIGEVAKLFADAGLICIASAISPYREDRDACRSILPDGDFIEVFMDVPLCVCEARDPKGLYKLARAGKIKGFTGIDDPYEAPLNSEIVLHQEGEDCPPPDAMADKVISYLEAKGYLQA
ncbi:adenylyl-sulfate kinase 3-like [Cynara cardunculus var. scolymus]|uniref:adenylyl-sulfate kinase 3-like n=1 Tax=Cynara cardunculus var. scolymus TaxID=59895 RepID=UPI000D6286E0|nr:adenylyl-sulfate kinase 3-like [Cynara cardunculus var. scolymus]